MLCVKVLSSTQQWGFPVLFMSTFLLPYWMRTPNQTNRWSLTLQETMPVAFLPNKFTVGSQLIKSIEPLVLCYVPWFVECLRTEGQKSSPCLPLSSAFRCGAIKSSPAPVLPSNRSRTLVKVPWCSSTAITAVLSGDAESKIPLVAP